MNIQKLQKEIPNILNNNKNTSTPYTGINRKNTSTPYTGINRKNTSTPYRKATENST